VFILPMLLTELKAVLESISDWKREAINAAPEAVANKLVAGFKK